MSSSGTSSSSKQTRAGMTLSDCPHFSLPVLRGPALPADLEAEDIDNTSENIIEISMPQVLRDPESEEAAEFSRLADEVARQLIRVDIQAQLIPSVTYIKNKGILLR